MTRRPAKTAARGYGGDHQKLRRAWAPIVELGGVVCWRCGRLIAAGAEWDLGHDDHDRRIYRGPEHLLCNRGTNRRGRKRKRKPRTLTLITSRQW